MYSGYPAFANTNVASQQEEISERIISAVGCIGLRRITDGFERDMRDFKFSQFVREGSLRPCTIIPRGHPARFWE